MAKKSLASFMKNAPNMSKKANELLHNRFILYFVFIIAVANLFHFVFSHDLMSVCVFIVAGLLTSFFSKNMVVIMVISIVVTHVVRFGNGGHEGFENKGSLHRSGSRAGTLHLRGGPATARDAVLSPRADDHHVLPLASIH